MLLAMLFMLAGLLLLALQHYIKKILFRLAMFIWGVGLVYVASVRFGVLEFQALWLIIYCLSLFIVATIIHWLIYLQIPTWSTNHPNWIKQPPNKNKKP